MPRFFYMIVNRLKVSEDTSSLQFFLFIWMAIHAISNNNAGLHNKHYLHGILPFAPICSVSGSYHALTFETTLFPAGHSGNTILG